MLQRIPVASLMIYDAQCTRLLHALTCGSACRAARLRTPGTRPGTRRPSCQTPCAGAAPIRRPGPRLMHQPPHSQAQPDVRHGAACSPRLSDGVLCHNTGAMPATSWRHQEGVPASQHAAPHAGFEEGSPVHVSKDAAARGDPAPQGPQRERILLHGGDPPVPQPALARVQLPPGCVPVWTCNHGTRGLTASPHSCSDPSVPRACSRAGPGHLCRCHHASPAQARMPPRRAGMQPLSGAPGLGLNAAGSHPLHRAAGPHRAAPPGRTRLQWCAQRGTRTTGPAGTAGSCTL